MDLYLTPVREILDDGSYVLEIKIGTSPRKISGIQKLIQIWMVTFLSDPGFHILDMNGGGGLSSFLGRNNTSYSRNDLKGRLAAAVDKTNKQIFDDQLTEDDIDDEELLETAYLLGVDFKSVDEIDVKIQLISKAGKSQAIIVPLA